MLGQIKLWLNIINIKYHMFFCYTFIFSLSLYLSLCLRKKFIFCVVLIFTAKACRYSDGVTHAHGTWWQDGCSADAKNCTCNDGIAKCLRLWVPCILQCKFQWKANGAFLCFSWYTMWKKNRQVIRLLCMVIHCPKIYTKRRILKVKRMLDVHVNQELI